ncbi:hypothetical protein FVE85_8208 [Porphyridium purpureum]|uniref:Uncharacterized protein n=1 Tax=Porphyridium purpureum TaxID=35688 RepID=A0A5J4YMI3_PORPP|nr:hypothetical protein FVE85_8208 [Porphyridium purpureum]|eukprot:POR6791..scf295_9
MRWCACLSFGLLHDHIRARKGARFRMIGRVKIGYECFKSVKSAVTKSKNVTGRGTVDCFRAALCALDREVKRSLPLGSGPSVHDRCKLRDI